MHDALKREIKKCCTYIESQLNEKSLDTLKNTSEGDLFLYHIGLGLWIRNNVLIKQSRLLKLFVTSGVRQKDDMSLIIINELHKYLNLKSPSSS